MARFVILGRTELIHGLETVPIGPTKQRAILALLLYHAGNPVPIPTVARTVWPTADPDAVKQRREQAVSRLRNTLLRARAPATISTTPDGAYVLDTDLDGIDYHRFTRLVRAGRHAEQDQDLGRAVALLTEAVDLWCGEPLADLPGATIDADRMRMAGELLHAVKLLCRSQITLGQHEVVLARLEPLIHQHRDDETLAGLWMRALAGTGRPQEARDFFVGFRRRLRRVVSAEPAAELVELYTSLRHIQRSAPPPAPLTVPVTTSAPCPILQLPPSVPDFVGRDQTLALLDQAAACGRVLVTGIGGAGKTAVVLRWAHHHHDQFPDGTIYLRLSDAAGPPPDASEVAARLLDVLGTPLDRLPSAPQARQDRLRAVLTDRRVLMILDDVVDATQVRPLLDAAAHGCIVVISRRQLTALLFRYGATSLTVPPLEHTEGLAFLRGRIDAHRAHAEPDALADLATAAAGHPLALRMISHYVTQRPAARLADLASHAGAYVLATASSPDGESTPRGVLAWTYDALSADQARTFRALGLHPTTTVSTGAAAALLATAPQQAAAAFDGLHQACLAEPVDERRHRLHDLAWRFAADLASADGEANRAVSLRRLASWYLLSAQAAASLLDPGRDPVPDLPAEPTIEIQHFNGYDAALRWCMQERENIVAVTRLVAERGMYEHAWKLPAAVHDVYHRYGRQDDMLECQQIALAAARSLGNQDAIAGTLSNLAGTHMQRHEYVAAEKYLRAALHITTTHTHNPDDEALYIYNIGSVLVRQGRPTEAIPLLRAALGNYRRLANLRMQAHCLGRLADTYRQLGHLHQAVLFGAEALAIRERIQDERGIGLSHAELAQLFLDAGQLPRALHHCRHALQVYEATHDEIRRCHALLTSVAVGLRLEQIPEALADAQTAQRLAEDNGDSRTQAHALRTLADALDAAGASQVAAQCRSRAHRIWRELDHARSPVETSRSHTMPAETTNADSAID